MRFKKIGNWPLYSGNITLMLHNLTIQKKKKNNDSDFFFNLSSGVGSFKVQPFVRFTETQMTNTLWSLNSIVI